MEEKQTASQGCGKTLKTAEILAVGTELLLGHTVNTDAAVVAQELNALGISVLYSSVVGDNPQRLKQALLQAFGRSDLVVTTGGLGPTPDDLTKEIAAECTGRKLVSHPESVQRIREYFRGRECGENQFRQALLPEGAQVFPNHRGTAPGCAWENGQGGLVLILPGPPGELVPMLQQEVIPFLKGKTGGVIASRMVHVFGMGEGAVAQRLGELTQGENPTVATYAKENEMFVRITARGETLSQAQDLVLPAEKQVCEILGDVVYTVNQDGSSESCLEETVVSLLQKAGKTLSAAESCTGGLLAKRLTDIPGASQILEMSFVTYANRAKEELLGVPRELLDTFGAVSPEVARAMAEGVRKVSGSFLGVGITGIAGPDGGTPEKPVGLVYIGLCDGERTWVLKLNPPGQAASRAKCRGRASSAALDMIRRRLTGLPQPGAICFSAQA